MDRYRRQTRKKRQTKKAQRESIIGILFLVVVLAVIVTACIVHSAGNREKEPVQPSLNDPEASDNLTKDEQSEKPAQTTASIVTAENNLPEIVPAYSIPEEIYSEAALCIRRSDKKAMVALNEDERLYPASITKVMTVVVALEIIDDWDATVTLPREMFAELLRQNASVAGFVEGEKVKAIDLVYAAMLPSGADGSIGLAFLISGSEDEYVKLMNEKAAELGMTNSHFANVTGLHNEQTYSTARDIVTLFDYALKNETFRQIISNSTYTTSSTNKHPGGLTMSSTVYSAFRSVTTDYDYILGGKTGYTEEAGQTLVTLAKINGEEYILVTLGAGNGAQKPKYSAMDAVTIYSMIEDATSASGGTQDTDMAA